MRKTKPQLSIGLKSIFISALFSFLLTTCLSQSTPIQSQYLGQTPPGKTPKIFPLSVDKGFFAAERIVISTDGRDIYYTEIEGYYPIKGENIKRYSFTGRKWTGPFDLFEGYAPAFSVTGDTMYFERKGFENESDTYISVSSGKNWSKPKRILTQLDTAHYFQATQNGNYFVSSKSGKGVGLSDWCEISINGADTTVLSLGRPLNTGGENQDFFVSRDESFMIVTNRPQLGISYRKSDGSWTNPRNFGPEINFGLGSWGPWVTPDDKYLFYTTGTKPDYSDVYVYWVRIDGAIDSLKHTNLSPYIKFLMPNQTAIAGQPFNFTMPDNIFFDDDNNAPLTYSATLMNGNPLPRWISFNSGTRTISGTPMEPGELTIRVIVEDTKKATAYCPVKIIITTNPIK